MSKTYDCTREVPRPSATVVVATMSNGSKPLVRENILRLETYVVPVVMLIDSDESSSS